MRWSRVSRIGLIVLALAAIASLSVWAMTLRQAKDPFASARKYAMRERSGYVHSLEGNYYMRTLAIRGKTRKEVNELAQPKIEAAGYTSYGTGGDYKRNGTKDYDFISIYDSKLAGEDVVMVTLCRPATKSELTFARIKNLGRSPLLSEEDASRELLYQSENERR
jgi:hypothetical protein